MLMDSLQGQLKNGLAEVIFSSANMLLAEIMVRCGLAPAFVVRPSVCPYVRPSSQLSLRQLRLLVLTSRVGCSSQYAQMKLEFRKKKI